MRGLPNERQTRWIARRVSSMIRDADMRGQQTYTKVSSSNAGSHMHQGKRHDGKGRIIAMEGEAIADGFAVAE